MPDRLKCLEILGLGSGATDAEIRQAYRDLVKVWHPDRFSHDPDMARKAQERMAVINGAYESLKRFPARPTPVSPYYSGPLDPNPRGDRSKPSPWANPLVSLIALLLGLVLFGLAMSAYYGKFYKERTGATIHEII